MLRENKREYFEQRDSFIEKLKKDNWEKVPENYVSVYHTTRLVNLDKIVQEGIKPYAEIDDKIIEHNERQKARMELRRITDELIDKQAEKLGIDLRRRNSFYCSLDSQGKWHEGEVSLELKLDPSRVYVFDADLATAVAISWLRTDSGREWLKNNFDKLFNQEEGKKFLEKLNKEKEYYGNYRDFAEAYWQRRIRLGNFLKLTSEEKQKLLKAPEILVPFKVDNKFIRINN